MSLVEAAMEPCVIMDKTTVSDGRSGVKTRWVEGADIKCAFAFTSSTEQKVANAMGEKSAYRITTHKNIVLQDRDVIKRLRDGKLFRIRTDGDDTGSPKGAGLPYRYVDAEEYVITGE